MGYYLGGRNIVSIFSRGEEMKFNLLRNWRYSKQSKQFVKKITKGTINPIGSDCCRVPVKLNKDNRWICSKCGKLCNVITLEDKELKF